jgi:Holliday junction resolvase RusA-like endonuclease
MVEASKKVAPFRKAIGDAARAALEVSGDDGAFTGPVVVRATFWLPKPSTVKRWLPTVPPDLDKICRALLDGLEQNGGVLASDSLVVDLVAAKRYARDLDAIGCDVEIVAVQP